MGTRSFRRVSADNYLPGPPKGCPETKRFSMRRKPATDGQPERRSLRANTPWGMDHGSPFLSVNDSIFGGLMSKTVTLPVLPLDDEVVLPAMVVPLSLTDDEVRGAIETARTAPGFGADHQEDKPQVLIVPRLNGKYAAVGTLAVIEQ